MAVLWDGPNKRPLEVYFTFQAVLQRPQQISNSLLIILVSKGSLEIIYKYVQKLLNG